LAKMWWQSWPWNIGQDVVAVLAMEYWPRCGGSLGHGILAKMWWQSWPWNIGQDVVAVLAMEYWPRCGGSLGHGILQCTGTL